MARLAPVSSEQSAPVVGPDAALTTRIWCNRPELAAAVLAFSGGVFGSERVLPGRVHEPARRRIGAATAGSRASTPSLTEVD